MLVSSLPGMCTMRFKKRRAQVHFKRLAYELQPQRPFDGVSRDSVEQYKVNKLWCKIKKLHFEIGG
jgi:hypothetical protein